MFESEDPPPMVLCYGAIAAPLPRRRLNPELSQNNLLAQTPGWRQILTPRKTYVCPRFQIRLRRDFGPESLS